MDEFGKTRKASSSLPRALIFHHVKVYAGSRNQSRASLLTGPFETAVLIQLDRC